MDFTRSPQEQAQSHDAQVWTLETWKECLATSRTYDEGRVLEYKLVGRYGMSFSSLLHVLCRNQLTLTLLGVHVG